MRVLNDLMIDSQTVALALTSERQEVDHMMVATVVATITSATPANKTFAAADVDITENTATITAHGFLTGLKVQVSNPGTLPTGISAATDYYIIVVDANTVKFATSQANALAGTAVDITNAGVGTNTVEVNATIAGTIKLQYTADPETVISPTWVDVAAATAISAAGTVAWNITDIGYIGLRAVATVTSGAIGASVRINAKGV